MGCVIGKRVNHQPPVPENAPTLDLNTFLLHFAISQHSYDSTEYYSFFFLSFFSFFLFFATMTPGGEVLLEGKRSKCAPYSPPLDLDICITVSPDLDTYTRREWFQYL
jgi:hypothetical protein